MWDIIDGGFRNSLPAVKQKSGRLRLHPADTIARKLNSSDASEYAEMIGFFGPRIWGKLRDT